MLACPQQECLSLDPFMQAFDYSKHWIYAINQKINKEYGNMFLNLFHYFLLASLGPAGLKTMNTVTQNSSSSVRPGTLDIDEYWEMSQNNEFQVWGCCIEVLVALTVHSCVVHLNEEKDLFSFSSCQDTQKAEDTCMHEFLSGKSHPGCSYYIDLNTWYSFYPPCSIQSS